MSNLSKQDFARRAAEIEWIVCDNDGVLTDGGLYYDRRGDTLLRFDVRDGLAIRLAQRAGIQVAVLSGRSSRALERRATELDFASVVTGSVDKTADFDQFLERHGTSPRKVAFIGDDLPDLTVLGRCGLSFAPADAVGEVRTVVDMVTKQPGGHGVVREVVEAVLKARGEWDRAVARFTFDSP